MDKQTYNEYLKKANNGTLADELNPIFLYNCVATDLLTKIISGEFDAKALAEHELKCRGLNNQGQWVGFK